MNLHLHIALIIAATAFLCAALVYRRTHSLFAAWLGGSFGTFAGMMIAFLYLATVVLI